MEERLDSGCCSGDLERLTCPVEWTHNEATCLEGGNERGNGGRGGTKSSRIGTRSEVVAEGRTSWTRYAIEKLLERCWVPWKEADFKMENPVPSDPSNTMARGWDLRSRRKFDQAMWV